MRTIRPEAHLQGIGSGGTGSSRSRVRIRIGPRQPSQPVVGTARSRRARRAPSLTAALRYRDRADRPSGASGPTRTVASASPGLPPARLGRGPFLKRRDASFELFRLAEAQAKVQDRAAGPEADALAVGPQERAERRHGGRAGVRQPANRPAHQLGAGLIDPPSEARVLQAPIDRALTEAGEPGRLLFCGARREAARPAARRAAGLTPPAAPPASCARPLRSRARRRGCRASAGRCERPHGRSRRCWRTGPARR